MKTTAHRLPGPSRRRGIALLTVLALLTLTAVMILAFFSISQTELRSTSCYAGGAEAHQLSKTAVDLVMHQIRAATEDSGTAWASQPGAIRVWGKHQGSESVAAYKLYSDDQMTLREPVGNPAEVPVSFTRALFQDTAELRDWHHQENKDVFVDLNEPILRTHVDQAGRERVKVYYPVVDPRAYYKGSQQQTVTRSDWETPSASAEDRKREVEGFYFETVTVERGPYPKRNGSKIDHHVGLPMPVKWLYQLKDGTLGTLERGALRPKFKAVSGDGVPSRNNPMVGRIAFWADDETCKLNVNTSAGGSPWDTPRAGGKIDREDFSAKQPVQKEYQRYPGHPATTSLAPVIFPNRNRAGESSKIGRSAAMDVAQAHEKIYEMVPRVQPGGSEGGLEFWKTNTPPIVPVDSDRLYATIDEFIFHATKKSSQGLREPQEAAGSWGQLDGDFLDRTKFFLTTSSRAPEVTVFNTPRISVWPTYYERDKATYEKSKRYTKFDKQIRFCAEVGQPLTNEFGHIYHFQRRNAHSPTDDFGTELNSRNAGEGILRNRQLFKYLVWLMKQDIPGVGKSLEDKYGDSQTQQIATEIFDYIRSTDLFDDMVFVDNNLPSSTPWANNSADHLAYTNNRVTGTTMEVHKGHGQVTPIEIKNERQSIITKGFGRFYSINEAGIAVICTATIPDPDTEPFKETRSKDEEDDLAANPVHVLGGQRVWNYKYDSQNSAAWTRYPWRLGANDKAWSPTANFLAQPPFDYTNVPPFSDPILRDPAQARVLVWDGHTLDAAKPADKAIMDKQTWVAKWYNPTWDYTIFETNKDKFHMVERWNYLINRNNWNFTLKENEPLKNPGECMIQAALIFSMYCPSKGWTAINPDYRLHVKVEDFKINDEPLFTRVNPDKGDFFEFKPPAATVKHWNERSMGGLLEPRAFTVGQRTMTGNLGDQMQRYSPDFLAWKDRMVNCGITIPDRENSAGDRSVTDYPWVSDPIKVPNTSTFLHFNGGTVEFKLFSGAGFGSALREDQAPTEPSQYVKIKMDSCDMPKPQISKGYGGQVQDGVRIPDTQVFARETWCFSRQGCFVGSGGRFLTHPGTAYQPNNNNKDPNNKGAFIFGGGIREHSEGKMDVVRSYVIPHGDYRVAVVRKSGDPTKPDLTSETTGSILADFVPHEGYKDAGVYAATAFSFTSSAGGYGRNELHVEYDDYKKKSPARQNINLLVKPLRSPDFDPWLEAAVPRNMASDSKYASLWGDWDNTTAAERDGAFINKPDEGNSRGIAISNYVNNYWRRYGYAPRQFLPYFTEPHQQEAPGASFFSPNRIVPGPGVFGSLSTGVAFAGNEVRPWQTLLFRPLPNNGRATTAGVNWQHPGSIDPKDHYLLDFFWMPVVEPWSISEPFSTAGKVNLNYAMQPFAHIKRASGVIGIMFSEQMLTIPSDQQRAYKGSWGRGTGYNYLSNTGGSLANPSLRSFIDHKETLKQFDETFNPPNLTGFAGKGDLFRTASQLCEKWLVPDPVFPPDNSKLKQDFTLQNTPSMWDQDNENGFTLVGDNSRERPYSILLARLTTKSNTFQVHYRSQMIKQSPTSPNRPGERRRDDEYETFDSDVDGVVAEYRGSTILERYIDPNEALTNPDPARSLPDYAKLAHEDALRLGEFNALDKFYRFRVVSEKRFAP